MTFSLVARSADGAQWGVVVASKFLAVGAAVPAASYGVGAIATQSFANLAYRPDGLALLAEGRSAEEVIATLTGADDLRDQRQVGIVDRDGGAATFTGSACNGWAGGRTGDGYAAQGNILTGPDVVDAMCEAYDGSAGAPLARRLLAGLTAGDAAGGDKRGRQSAALYVVSEGGGYGGGSDVLVDVRVDDHPQPVAELARLLDLYDLYFGKPESVLPLEGSLAQEVAARLAALGYPTLDAWAGVENYEERMVSGGIDPVVLEKLREA